MRATLRRLVLDSKRLVGRSRHDQTPFPGWPPIISRLSQPHRLTPDGCHASERRIRLKVYGRKLKRTGAKRWPSGSELAQDADPLNAPWQLQIIGTTIDFGQQYVAMVAADTIGADPYFHCVANCLGTRRGGAGFVTSVLISIGREIHDIWEHGASEIPWSVGDVPSDEGDMLGATGSGSCQQVCGGRRLDPRTYTASCTSCIWRWR